LGINYSEEDGRRHGYGCSVRRYVNAFVSSGELCGGAAREHRDVRCPSAMTQDKKKNSVSVIERSRGDSDARGDDERRWLPRTTLNHVSITRQLWGALLRVKTTGVVAMETRGGIRKARRLRPLFEGEDDEGGSGAK